MSTFKSMMLLIVIISMIPVILSIRQSEEPPVAMPSPIIEQPMLELPPIQPVVTQRQYPTDLRAYEQRDAKFRRFLAASVQVDKNGGSGTIIYYDTKTKEAYILSCGHIWSNKFSLGANATQLRHRPKRTRIIVWYHDMTKLLHPRAYVGDVLFWDIRNGEDCALIKVKIDWIPEVFTIAENRSISGRYRSLGCDSSKEVAYYGIEILGRNKQGNLVTRYNIPRPGRSGGGLLAQNQLVGICIATNPKLGYGFFTSLAGINRLFKKNGYGWLLSIEPNIARTMPIKDWDGMQAHYPLGYVAMPTTTAIPLD